MGLTENATIKELQEIPNISSENRVRSIRTFPNEKNNIFVNFHIISAYNSEISSELSEYSEKNSELSEYSEWPLKKIRNCLNTPNWPLKKIRNCPNTPRKKIRNCPNTPNDLRKKFGIIRIDLGKKFGIPN
jgi:hypothetical protein